MPNKYKPTIVKESGGKGDSGVASIQWSDTKCKISFEELDTVYKVLREDLPEYAQEWDLSTAFVTMDGNNENVFSMRPVSGVFTVKCTGFSRQGEADEPAAPQQRTGKFGIYYTFNALLEIVGGKFKGAIYPYYLYYKFTDYEGVAAIKGDGTASQKLMDFLDNAGAWDAGELEYDDNILPALEKRIKSAHKKFQIVVKKGYVESTLEVEIEDDEPEPEKEQPKKKQKVEEEEIDEFPDPAPKKKSALKKTDDEDI